MTEPLARMYYDGAIPVAPGVKDVVEPRRARLMQSPASAAARVRHTIRVCARGCWR